MKPCKVCRKSSVATRRQAAKLNPNPRSEKPKHCGQCGELKPASEFYSNEVASTGLTSWCKDCHKVSSIRSHKVRLATLDYAPTSEPKQCSRCDVVKPPEMFNKSRINSSGLVAQCKDCEKDYRKTRNFPRQTDPKVCNNCGLPALPDRMFKSDPYHKDGREPRCVVCLHKKSYNPDGTYTGHDYLRIEQEQGGHCQFYSIDSGGCSDMDSADKALHIDHDSGKIRGLLCHNHNRRVVSLFDRLSPEQLCEILRYTDKLSGVIDNARYESDSDQ